MSYGLHLLFIWLPVLAGFTIASIIVWIKRDSYDTWPLVLAGVVFVFSLLLVIPISISIYRSTATSVSIHIDDKERIAEAKSGRYLVYSPSEVFEDTDSYSFWKLNSSDVYGSLERGKTYQCTVAGWRVPFFSQYRNIISCEVSHG